MKLESPKLGIEENATLELIQKVLSSLKEEEGSFAILSESKMSYIQALMTKNGFIVQFQDESLDRHYEFDNYLSRSQTIVLFQKYLNKSPNWSGLLKYKSKNIRGFRGYLGLIVGRFVGGFIRGINETKRKT
ncbi:hypothetical protein P886_1975 [Alteromonadaceae bacterium 2753L.S.0a.02]|nr:hypothetical protein P886_1975 [Alteromonadaceae bacterium 2753L.S.0a.02]